LPRFGRGSPGGSVATRRAAALTHGVAQRSVCVVMCRAAHALGCAARSRAHAAVVVCVLWWRRAALRNVARSITITFFTSFAACDRCC